MKSIVAITKRDSLSPKNHGRTAIEKQSMENTNISIIQNVGQNFQECTGVNTHYVWSV